MKQYLDLLKAIQDGGNHRGDRTGTGTQSIFGYQFRCDLAEGFPLLTTKKLSFKNILVELLWFLKGDTNIKYLLWNDVHIWTDDCYRMYKRVSKDNGHLDEELLDKQQFERSILEREDFAKQYGDLGPIYGKQWCHWKGEHIRFVDVDDVRYTRVDYQYFNQIKNVIESIKKNPEGRRHIVTAWNPAEVDAMALPPCHCLFQFYVHEGKLSCHLYQRSADVFLGVPYNIASYALLTHIIAHQTDLAVGDLVISFGDVHIYNNHRDQVAEQLTREPKALPELFIGPKVEQLEGFMNYMPHNFSLQNYDPHPAIRGELSVGV